MKVNKKINSVYKIVTLFVNFTFLMLPFLLPFWGKTGRIKFSKTLKPFALVAFNLWEHTGSNRGPSACKGKDRILNFVKR